MDVDVSGRTDVDPLAVGRDEWAERLQHASARGRTAAGSSRLDRYERVQVVIDPVETSGRRADDVGVVCSGGDVRGDATVDVIRIVRERGLDRRHVQIAARIDCRVIQTVASDQTQRVDTGLKSASDCTPEGKRGDKLLTWVTFPSPLEVKLIV